jgi:hypothetical protein
VVIAIFVSLALMVHLDHRVLPEQVVRKVQLDQLVHKDLQVQQDRKGQQEFRQTLALLDHQVKLEQLGHKGHREFQQILALLDHKDLLDHRVLLGHRVLLDHKEIMDHKD